IAAPGQIFAKAFAVAALDSFLNQIPQATVTFRCDQFASWENGDTLVTVVADSFGIARAHLKAGSAPGRVAVCAWTSGLEAKPAVFRDVFVSRGEAVALQKAAGDSQRARAGTLLPAPLIVKALLSSGDPAPDEVVTFEVTAGEASFVPADWCATGSDGLGQVNLRLGQQHGTVRVRAALASGKGQPVTFTIEVVPNHAPVVQVATDTTITETDSLYLPIRVSDPDGDPVFVQVSNLPQGARLDTTRGYALTWRPSYSQSGDWPVEITAADTLGASTTVTSTVHVLNRNRAPVITAWQPADSVVAINRGGTLTFSVVAVDPDSDQLRIRWYVDEQLQGEGADFVVQADQLGPGRHLVAASVSDGDKAVAHHWWLDILTAVQLEAFEGTFTRDGAIELHWSVSDASDVVRYVLERQGADGQWTTVARVPQGAADASSFHYTDMAPAGQSSCVYRLKAVVASGEKRELGKITVEVPLPKQFKLYPVYPNPFNPTARIRFDVPKTERVQIRVFDLKGRLVQTLFDGRLAAGYHRFDWQAVDQAGRSVPSGTYLIVATWPGGRSVQKVVLLK
ncbi:MAG TPA: T9SS type A sorting domain-containing protein, partial [Bacteroidetes bacterium]|nr:T9SS type A sorting domain-containing protein [Bacteroidota bacterium]